MPKVTYSGPFSRGTVRLATRSVSFVRSEAIEVTADEAAQLGDEWTVVKPKSKPSPTEGTTTNKKEAL